MPNTKKLVVLVETREWDNRTMTYDKPYKTTHYLDETNYKIFANTLQTQIAGYYNQTETETKFRGLDELTPETASMIRMRLEGESYQKIGSAHGCSYTQSRDRIRNGLIELALINLNNGKQI